MTANGPDPDPRTTPGLEKGSGVPPGETPPDSAQTSGTTHPQPQQSKAMSRVWLLAIALAVVLVAGFFLAYLIVYLLNGG